MLNQLKDKIFELRLKICRIVFKDNFHEDPLDCIKAKKVYIKWVMKKIKFACLKILPKKEHTLDTVVIYTVVICIVSGILGILGYSIYNNFFSVEALEIPKPMELVMLIKITQIDEIFQFIFVETEVEKILDEDELFDLMHPDPEPKIEEDEEEVIHTVEEYNQIVIDEKDIPIPEALRKFREEEAEKLKEKVDLVFIEYVYSIFQRVDENLGHIIKIMFDMEYEELMNFICSIDSYFRDCLNSFKNEIFSTKFIYKLNLINLSYNFILIFFFFFSFSFIIHSFFSLYSVYVDYFQKQSIQSTSAVGFIPFCIILILLFFIFFCIFYYFFKLYYIKVLWLIFI